MRFLLSAAVLLLLANPWARADTAKDERALIQLVEQINVALTKADMPFLERVLHKDFVLTSSKGKLEGRSEYISNRRSGGMVYLSKTSDEIKVLLFGDAAIVTGRDTEKARANQREMEGQYRWTRVFVRHDGRWQLVSAQFTPVPPS